MVGEAIELARKMPRGFLKELGRRAQAGRKSLDMQHTALDARVQGVRQALGQLVDPLGGMTQQNQRVRQAARQPDQPMLQLAELALHAVEHAVVELREAMRELGADRHRELGGGRGRRGAPVGGIVDQRRVGLVSDRRDQGMRLAAAARTTISSLNAHRSSSEPPPRATISTSGRGTGPSPAGR